MNSLDTYLIQVIAVGHPQNLVARVLREYGCWKEILLKNDRLRISIKFSSLKNPYRDDVFLEANSKWKMNV